MQTQGEVMNNDMEMRLQQNTKHVKGLSKLASKKEHKSWRNVMEHTRKLCNNNFQLSDHPAHAHTFQNCHV